MASLRALADRRLRAPTDWGRMRAAVLPLALLAAILALGLVLRLRHNGYGLPYVYNADEGNHFTNRAVAMFGGDPDPGYFQNPSAFTYLVHTALRFQFGGGWPFAVDGAKVVRQFARDPTAIWTTARGVAAVLCSVGVVGVWWVGRRLWGQREGLVAAALLGLAFLPVAYSRVAVTDVGTLAPVAVSVYGAVRAHERGRRRDFLLAGAAAGLAIGFKYTAGLVLVPLLIAAGARARVAWRPALAGLGLGLLAALLVFALTTPYFFIDFGDARRQLSAQSSTVGDVSKIGQRGDNGPGYYLGTLGWGLGWAAALLALAGAVLEARRDRFRAALLLAFPLVLFVYLSAQSRYFGRWLLPIYPVLALLAAVAVVRLAALVRGPRAVRTAALAALTLVALAQPVAADWRSMRVLGRSDTRQLAREWLVRNDRPALRAIIEPAVPARYYVFRSAKGRFADRRKQFVRSFIKEVKESRIDYVATLTPGLVDLYRRNGFCTVMTMSLFRGRAEHDRVRRALAYYDRLARESTLVYRVSPYKRGAKPLSFSFDLSYNYYPAAFARPGPEVRIYRLRSCTQRYGAFKAAGVATPAVGSGG